MRVIIIGSGIAGLAAAARLASRGHLVTVFEGGSTYGGKMGEIRKEGYRFDWGPSLFTMPQYLTEIFELAGKSTDEYFSYRKLKDICHYFWEDGARLIATADPLDFAENVEKVFGVRKEIIIDYLRNAKFKFDRTSRVFLEQSLHKAANYFSKDVIKGLLAIPSLSIFQTLHNLNTRILREPHMVQFFNRYATYNGSDPYQTPGIMSSIAHLEFGYGAFFPTGGMRSIPTSLFRLCEDLGVKFHFDMEVEKILNDGQKVTGVQIENRKIEADVVVSNADTFYNTSKLLSKENSANSSLKLERSSSALIFYWGITAAHEQLGLHNILFSKDYKEEFRHIWKLKSIYHDPTVYINISSKLNPADAPNGNENWFTMINVPHIDGQNWDEIIASARINIISKISRTLRVDVEPLIKTETIVDPEIIQSKTRSYLGALYGTSSNNRYAAFLRPANFSSGTKGLYFCGGSVHPGGGIPLCLLSAKIVDELILRSTKSDR